MNVLSGFREAGLRIVELFCDDSSRTCLVRAITVLSLSAFERLLLASVFAPSLGVLWGIFSGFLIHHETICLFFDGFRTDIFAE